MASVAYPGVAAAVEPVGRARLCNHNQQSTLINENATGDWPSPFTPLSPAVRRRWATQGAQRGRGGRHHGTHTRARRGREGGWVSGAWALQELPWLSGGEVAVSRTLSQSATGPSVLSRTGALTGLSSGADAEGAQPRRWRESGVDRLLCEHVRGGRPATHGYFASEPRTLAKH